jgi:hypothetical protein
MQLPSTAEANPAEAKTKFSQVLSMLGSKALLDKLSATLQPLKKKAAKRLASVTRLFKKRLARLKANEGDSKPKRRSKFKFFKSKKVFEPQRSKFNYTRNGRDICVVGCTCHLSFLILSVVEEAKKAMRNGKKANRFFS